MLMRVGQYRTVRNEAMSGLTVVLGIQLIEAVHQQGSKYLNPWICFKSAMGAQMALLPP